jgi:mRNA interferase MazF
MEVAQGDVVLCEFYFSDLKTSKNRPVLVLKDNLPFNDFVAIPISSKIEKMQIDELFLQNSDFTHGAIPKDSKVMIRKTFVVSKNVVLKKYGSLSKESFERFSHYFCQYFACLKS